MPCALCLVPRDRQRATAHGPSAVTRRQGCVWPVTPWPVAVVRQKPTKCATKTQRAVWERRRGSGRRAKRRAVATCYWRAPGTQTPRASGREMAGAWGEVQRRRGRARGRLDGPSQAPHRPPLRILSACFLYVGTPDGSCVGCGCGCGSCGCCGLRVNVHMDGCEWWSRGGRAERRRCW